MDLGYTSRAWRRGTPHGHLINSMVALTDMQLGPPSRVSRKAQYTSVVAPISGPTQLVDSNQFRDARLILLVIFHLFVCLFVFFVKGSRPESPVLTKRANPNRSPVYSDRFHISYQNILFISFCFRVFKSRKHFQMVGP